MVIKFNRYLFLSLVIFMSQGLSAKARDEGVYFDGIPGKWNAITDVPGVKVGHRTLIKGDSDNSVRTGVTAISIGDDNNFRGVPASYFSFNGTGELSGSHVLNELGMLYGPILLTGTTGVGAARDGALMWAKKSISNPYDRFTQIIPVIGETYDGVLNDAWGLHLSPKDAYDAIYSAKSGPVAEGSVGGGTGMKSFDFKSGIGTSSRIIEHHGKSYTVGVLVQSNFGRRSDLTIKNVSVGKFLKGFEPSFSKSKRDGSIIVAIATDAPLIPTQLKRLAKRATIGMAKTGGIGTSTSGDIFLAFSTAPLSYDNDGLVGYHSFSGFEMDNIFDAVVQATEEAIINSLFAGETMTGFSGNKVYGLPVELVKDFLK